ncbi:MAG: prolipoprotein diacylglyceryl transferase [Candidatus Brocadia sp.]
MANELFLVTLSGIFAVLLWWGFKTLPGEGWQIIASLPVSRDESGAWKGINLTYYGLFTASAYVIAVALLFILMGAIGIPVKATSAMVIILLLNCVPASRLMARVIERKLHTFTIGGASFVGVLIAPWAIWFANKTLGTRFDYHIPFIPALASFIISYAFGEGMGRLACISFGCCYGKPLSDSHSLVQRFFRDYYFVFFGKTKKIAYESGLDGVKVIPIQAITAILHVTTGVIGIFLFLKSYYVAAFTLTMAITQIWRLLSEMFRADYRGEGMISAYQIMAIISIIYSSGIVFFLPSALIARPDVTVGLLSLWNPALLFFFLIVWLGMFLYTGRSTVTGSTLTFHVHRDRV